MLKALRQVFKYGIDYGVSGIKINPTSDVPYLKSNNPTGHHSWTPEGVFQFEEGHPVGTKSHLAIALLLYTGQRRSDIVPLGRQHIKKAVWSSPNTRTENPNQSNFRSQFYPNFNGSWMPALKDSFFHGRF
jgi:integrase